MKRVASVVMGLLAWGFTDGFLGGGHLAADQTPASVVIEVPTGDGAVTFGVLGKDQRDAEERLPSEVATTLDDLEGAALSESPRDSRHIQRLRDARTAFAQGKFNRINSQLPVPGAVGRQGRSVMTTERSCGDWWPSWINGRSNPSSLAGQRYGRTKFTWSSTRLSAFQCYTDPTFEPDFVTYNYDGKYYFSKSVQSWSTDMPNGYLDTPFADSADERVYTVGTSRVTHLDPGRTYYSYFRTTNGNSGSDSAKVVAQRGRRIPSWCDSTWCIFAQESVIYFNGWTLPVPGTSTM